MVKKRFFLKGTYRRTQEENESYIGKAFKLAFATLKKHYNSYNSSLLVEMFPHFTISLALTGVVRAEIYANDMEKERKKRIFD